MKETIFLLSMIPLGYGAGALMTHLLIALGLA